MDRRAELIGGYIFDDVPSIAIYLFYFFLFEKIEINITMNFYASPAWSIKGKHNSTHKADNIYLNPSPTTYNPQLILKKSPAWKIGRELR